MAFQRDHGLIPTGILDRKTLLSLDEKLQELDRGDRTEALPAPRPLRGVAASYIESDLEQTAYERVRDDLRQIRDRTTTAPEANLDDLVAVFEWLESLTKAQYPNVLRALAASRESNAWAPTLLDLLLALPASISDEADLRECLCAQLLRKLGGSVSSVLNHASPDSMSRLQGAPSFLTLLRVLG